MTPHPTYPNPQIVEALCEFHYSLPQGQTWKLQAGNFFRAIESDYPEMEPIAEQVVQLVVGSEGVPVQQLLPARLKFKFKKQAGPFLLQLSDKIFSINVLAPYPGWEKVKRELSAVWPKFLLEVKPTTITRIGMRYINRIPLRSLDDRPGDWLRANDFIPAAVLNSTRNYLSRVEAELPDSRRHLVTIAHDPSGAQGALILDIDCISLKSVQTKWEDVEPEVDELHNQAWEIFASSKGEQLEKLLRQEGI